MNFPEKPELLEQRSAVASLVAMREGALAPAGDAALVETDFAPQGFSGLEVLRELLSAPVDLPIVVTFGRAISVEAGTAPEVRTMMRRPAGLGDFRSAIQRMGNAGGRMYLSVGV
ncbi:MAG: hypothetical protein JSS40_08920 [Proteobacteria bacterium]|nr:hypothetical protein [Pseudomonadota bacterium]